MTQDAAGAAVPGCTVDLFEAQTDTKIDSTTSDGAGAWSFSLGGNAGNYFVRAYKAGAPDLAGTSVDTLTAS